MNTKIFAPGLAPGMTNDAYQAAEGVSKSQLDDIAPECGNTPHHYWAKRLKPDREVRVKTPALILGDATHKAVLEPDLMSVHFAVPPKDAPKYPSTTQWNAEKPSPKTIEAMEFWTGFQKENRGKFVMSPDDMQTVLDCRDAIHTHPVARHLFRGGNAEQSFFAIDPETGATIKCRTDYERIAAAEMIVDLKTTESAGEDEFGGSATKYRYDVQGVWYPDVIHAAYNQPLVKHFVFVALEKGPAKAVGIYYLEQQDIAPAREMARRDFNRILECRAAEAAGDPDPWPDQGSTPGPLRIRRQVRARQLRSYT